MWQKGGGFRETGRKCRISEKASLGFLASVQNREKGRAFSVLDYRSEFRGHLIPSSCIPEQGITPRTHG